ncbi:hypothetical protein [Gymnodinialimonas ceratoperidinii]|uniref:Uncharacterized protein n=1 Tax=Gymnodinialimonas ceratoperidinii TaxID=2856823 RepID=A0A8F6YD50_9RHOB|nr:hypothetical protein [Gymnodinialimonas ceratoperidinii]QXT40045.1 hypothetical protein KYE46_01925 [Gymnodinialimonas ceratoperidinii]
MTTATTKQKGPTMNVVTDHDGRPLFGEAFTHETHVFEGISIDVIRTEGRLWLSAPSVFNALGFEVDGGGGGFNRRLRRVSHPDAIKVEVTPFRFTDGRRNRSSLISPRAVTMFANAKTKGRNPIKANAFVAWMEETLLDGKTVVETSPARAPQITLEPTFRSVIKVTDQDAAGRPIDPLRTDGPYWGCGHLGPLMDGEINFEGPTLWRNDTTLRIAPMDLDDDDDFCLIDETDVFWATKETSALPRYPAQNTPHSL